MTWKLAVLALLVAGPGLAFERAVVCEEAYQED